MSPEFQYKIDDPFRIDFSTPAKTPCPVLDICQTMGLMKGE